ncbi:MAG: hypothetical protein AB7P76_04060 [Candidatus Melainabacteria bacterium]
MRVTMGPGPQYTSTPGCLRFGAEHRGDPRRSEKTKDDATRDGTHREPAHGQRGGPADWKEGSRHRIEKKT